MKNCEVKSEHRFVWHGRWTDTKNARGHSPRSFAFGSGYVSGAFAPETN
jgi:hypothetical protein